MEGNIPYIVRQTFPEMFDNSVIKYGDCRCQLWINERNKTDYFTYAQLSRIVKELAAGLIYFGIKKHDRIAIVSDNCPQWLWADFSILNAAAITVPIFPTFSQREMAFIINDSSCRFVYVEDEKILQKVMNLWDEMPSLEKIIVMDNNYSGHHPGIINLSDLREIGEKFLFQYPLTYEKRWRSVELNDNMTIIYTSGTSYKRKGAVHTHFSMNAANCLDFKVIPDISKEDVHLEILPLSHSYQRQFGQMMSIAVGGTIAYSHRDMTVIENIQHFKPTWFLAVPRIYESIFVSIRRIFSDTPENKAALESAMEIAQDIFNARADKNGFINTLDNNFLQNISAELKQRYTRADKEVYTKIRQLLGNRYRFSISAAGGLPAKLGKFFIAIGLPILEGNGMIETCNTINLNRINKILPGSVGPTAPGVEGFIAEDGEWLVRGDNIIREYWNNSEETAKVFNSRGFFYTGDIVEELADGYIKLIGEKRSLLVLNNGKKVPPSKLEDLFRMSDYVDQLCIVGDNCDYITALVVPKFNYFIRYFRENSVKFNETALQYMEIGEKHSCIKVGLDFIANKYLKNLIDEEIQRVNEQIEDYEVIKKYQIINRRFTETANEVGPTMKFKREIIYKNFSVEINKLYDLS